MLSWAHSTHRCFHEYARIINLISVHWIWESMSNTPDRYIVNGNLLRKRNLHITDKVSMNDVGVCWQVGNKQQIGSKIYKIKTDQPDVQNVNHYCQFSRI